MTGSVIGALNETGLHRSLKQLYLTPEAIEETEVEKYIIDVVRPDLLIEIQTGGFSGIRTKLSKLIATRRLRLVHPVAAETFISVYTESGSLRSRRRSPKRGSLPTAAAQLLYLTELLPHPNLSIELLLVRQEEIRIDDGKGSWRRKGVSIGDRRLVEIIDRALFDETADYLRLLPPGLPPLFGNREIAKNLPSTGTGARGKLKLAGQLSYLLRKLGLIEVAGKDGKRLLFRLSCLPEHNQALSSL